MKPSRPQGDERTYLFVLLAVVTVVASAISALVVDLNRNFLISAADTSVFHNTIVNLIHGHGFRVTAYSGPNLLGQHTMFVLALIAPIYALIPSVDTLFVLQVFVIYSTVIPIYLLAQQILQNSKRAFFVALLALISPLLVQMCLAPFHPESGILAAAFWSYYFYRRNRMIRFGISFLLAVSCAEQAAFIYIALSLALFIANDGLAWRGLYSRFALIGGAVWLIVAIGIFIPLMYSPGQLNVMHYHYSQWNAESASDLIRAVIADPVRALAFLLDPTRWLHVAALVGLPFILAFLDRRCLLLLLPFPFYFLLSDHEFFLDFHAYYFQFAFLAGYLGLIFFLERRKLSAPIFTTALVACVVLNLAMIATSQRDITYRFTQRNVELNLDLHRAFATIPADAGVYTPTRYCAYLSNRTNVVIGDIRDPGLDLDQRLTLEQPFTGVRPDQIELLVCDYENDQTDSVSGSHPDYSELRDANLKRLVNSGHWQHFWNEGRVVILRRTGK